MINDQSLPPRTNGRPHLSECLLVTAFELEWGDPESYHCTCDDDDPEWTT